MTDQFEPAYRTLVVACKSDKRWFDLDAVRTPYTEGTIAQNQKPSVRAGIGNGPKRAAHPMPRGMKDQKMTHDAGAPPLDYWLLDTQDGVDRVLKSMLPEKVCRVCGEPSRRIVEATYNALRQSYPDGARSVEAYTWRGDIIRGKNSTPDKVPAEKVVETLGWTDCECDLETGARSAMCTEDLHLPGQRGSLSPVSKWRSGVVLDPFDLTSERTEVGQARYIIGDIFDTLATLPDDSVDLVFSSPPFLALRSYLPADHPNKAKEIGSEATPADFLDTLLDVVEACDRVLAPHGSLCFELGDTFAGSGGAGGDYRPGGLHDGQPAFTGSMKYARVSAPGMAHPIENKNDGRQQGGGVGWPLPKSLCLLSTLFPACLAYGRNLLRPERTTPRWRIRNVVVWARPNPPVGALGDKFRPATSYLTVACKSDKRWFDLDAVRTEHSEPGADRQHGQRKSPGGGGDASNGLASGQNPAGAPPLDYWEIPTHPYKNSHYATFPPALCVKPVKAMCPSSVCRTCGEPRRRIVGEATYVNARSGEAVDKAAWSDPEKLRQGAIGRDNGALREAETLGWTDCGHNDWRAGMLLDPFAGSGTTLAVATGHGRDAIGCDLDARNAELALERVGPLFLTVETLEGTKPFAPPPEDVETDAV